MDIREPDFQEVYAAYQPRILRYLARLAGEDEAEDLAQEVFARVATALADFRGESSLSTWLYRIATHAAVDRMRSVSFRHTTPACSPDALQEVQDGNVWTGERTPAVEQQIYRGEMSACVREYIGKLPADYRTVLVLGELEGLANVEIAEVLQVSVATVKIRLHRARQRLEAELAANCEAYWVEENEFLPELRGVRTK